MPPELPRNHVSITIDGFYISALVVTGSCISVLSLSLCRRLRKVLLPRQGPVFPFSFNSMSSPIASATSRLIINGTCYPCEFRVFKESSHEVILGCDFLVQNEAIIDYVYDELLLSEGSSYHVVESQIMIPRLCLKFDTVVLPESTSFIYVLVSTSPLHDGDVLVKPKRNALAKKGLVCSFLFGSS